MIKIEISGDKENEVTNPEGEPATFVLKEKEFKTGSTGFHAFGKVLVDGEKYQANLLLVKVGSKVADK
jgi:hypothetical protein